MSLTQERALSLLRYDPETGKVFWLKRHGKEAGHKTRGYLSVRIDQQDYMLHRVIWLMVYGFFPAGQLDHKDRDRSNNRLANLREATPAQQGQNQSIRVNNSSGLKGVSFDHTRNLWLARIRDNGKRINLGRFTSKEAAAEAYKFAAEKLHGEFASHNSRR
jgi:hypothetical protein